MVGVSAVSGTGIKELLEYILLTADLKNLRADPLAAAQGVVIESHQETGLGPVATVLVQNGTLRPGDVVVFSETYGKIRSMTSYSGVRIMSAEPSTPAQIAGLQAIPEFGESFAAVKNERIAREVIEQTAKPAAASHSIGDISRAIAEGKTDSLKIILKTDTQGSLEAIKAAVNKLQEPGVKPLIIHDGIGDISLSDVQLAQATGSIVYGFHVELSPQIRKAATSMGVTVMTFKIIYDLLNQIELILKGLVKVEKIRVERGRLKVLKVFRTTKDGQVIGGEITQGEARNPAFITIQRESEPVGDGKITSLQKGPEAMAVLESGQEAGLAIQANTRAQVGDVIIFATEEEVVAAENTQTG